MGWDVCGAHRARSFRSACTATGSIGIGSCIAAPMRSGSVRGIDAHGTITPPRGGRTVRFALAVMSFSHMPSAPHDSKRFGVSARRYSEYLLMSDILTTTTPSMVVTESLAGYSDMFANSLEQITLAHSSNEQ